MSDKVEKFLSRMGNIWPRKIAPDAMVEWLAEWEGALKQFDGWVIDAAATRIVHDRTSDRFPLPADVRNICFQILAEDRAAKPRLDDVKKPHDPYKFAYELLDSDLGRRAAREGWALTLRDFIARELRLPDQREIRRLIQIRDEFVTKLTECKTGRGGLFGAPLAKLGQSMVNREHEIAKRILGNEAGEWYAGKF